MKFSEEEKAMWLEDWRRSGKGAWTYAKENGLTPQTFVGWTKAKTENKPCFVEVATKAISAERREEILIEKGEVKTHIPLTIGSRFKIRNEIWLVAGVIDDGNDDHSRLYVPSSVRGGGADALMALASGGVDEAYVKNSLKTLGIQEMAYNFFNLGTITDHLWERAAIVPLLFFALLLLSLLRPLAHKFKASFTALKEELGRRYIGQILSGDRKIILKPSLYALELAIFPILALFLFLRLASVCLPWQDIPSLAIIGRELFYPHLERLRDYEFASRLVFFVSLAVLGGVVACVNVYLFRKYTRKLTHPFEDRSVPSSV